MRVDALQEILLGGGFIPRRILSAYNGFMEWLWAVVAVAEYVVLMKWVLPRFGVPT